MRIHFTLLHGDAARPDELAEVEFHHENGPLAGICYKGVRIVKNRDGRIGVRYTKNLRQSPARDGDPMSDLTRYLIDEYQKIAGLTMERACPACGARNGRDEKICHECSADIGTVPPTIPPYQARKNPPPKDEPKETAAR